MKHIKPLQLGSLTLKNNILYAPLAGCSDFPYRKMSSRYSPGLIYCEMVKMDALIRHDPGTYRLLDYSSDMHPIGAQLCGSKPQLAAECARIIEDLGFDVIDLNCGCPVDKVTKDGSGSGLLKTPFLIGEIISEMVNAVSIPVTVKIRAGWDEVSLNGPTITHIAESAGAKAIAIHGRTRKQAYKGSANWNWITECKKAANEIKIIANGDIMSGSAAKEVFEQTGCDAVLIARGTMGSPWAAEEIIDFLSGKPYPQPGSLYKEILLNHLDATKSYENDRRSVLAMRRVGCWYLKKGRGTKKLRESLNRSKNLLEIRSMIETYDWSQVSYENS
jgi:tRNA-dihydrouridine synthase B